MEKSNSNAAIFLLNKRRVPLDELVHAYGQQLAAKGRVSHG